LTKEVQLAFVDTPLRDVAQQLQKTLGVPVMLDQRALDEVGIAADQPITFAVSGVTAESALLLLLRQMDLVALPRQEILLITTPDRAAESLAVKVYEVGDLIAPDQEPAKLDSLIEVITTTVEPVSWDAVGGPGSVAPVGRTLVISQTRAVHREIAGLLDAMREMQTGKSVGTLGVARPAERKALATISEKLGRPVQVDFVDTPLGEVVSRISKEWDIPVLLDSKALDEVGIASDAPITLKLEGVPARTILESILQPLDLTWMIHAEVLLFTTPDRADESLSLRVYNVDALFQDDAKADQVIKAITSTIEPTSWDEVGGPGSIVPFRDQKPALLIISQTEDAHDQIERLLTSLRP
jgi:hypothetical protein